MKRGTVLVAILCVLSLSATGIGWGGIRDPYTYTVETTNPTRTVIVGVTMGNGWSGFPDLLAPDYAPQNPPYEELDVELPLYVTWIIDWDHTGDPPQPQPVNPSQPLSSYSWFAGHHDEFWVTQIAQVLDDTDGYNACPTGGGLEAPEECTNSPCDVGGPFPLTADGKLRVTDIHGGIGDITRIHLVKETCCEGGVDESYNIVFQWDRPGTWYDSQLGIPVDFTPGMTRHDRIEVSHGPPDEPEVPCWMPTRIVEWVSTDLGVPGSAGPSPRSVDGSDLAYWYSVCNGELGHPARFGFATETPPNSPTFQCNVVPWGSYIDGSDIAGFYADLGKKSCQLSKAGADEFAAMLDWFGVAATGRMLPVNPDGDLAPEYAVVDWEKNRRAIADPYGYRTNLNSPTPAKETPWGLVKQLYR